MEYTNSEDDEDWGGLPVQKIMLGHFIGNYEIILTLFISDLCQRKVSRFTRPVSRTI